MDNGNNFLSSIRGRKNSCSKNICMKYNLVSITLVESMFQEVEVTGGKIPGLLIEQSQLARLRPTLRIPLRHFMECPSVWICLMFFSGLNWGLGHWRGGPQRWRAILITSHQGCMLTTWFITEGVNLNDPTYIVFARLEMDYFSTNSSFLFREALGQRFVMSDLGSGNINC